MTAVDEIKPRFVAKGETKESDPARSRSLYTAQILTAARLAIDRPDFWFPGPIHSLVADYAVPLCTHPPQTSHTS